MEQRRRSRRHERELAVQLVVGRARHEATTENVSRHGLFLTTEVSLEERQLVQLVVDLPDGRLPATAVVSHVAEEGVGLQLFALSAWSKKRWDDFLRGLDRAPRDVKPGQPASRPDVAVFLIRLKNVGRLLDFYDENITRGSLFLTTPVLREQGSEVVLNIIHPTTEQEFMLSGRVDRVCVEVPKGMEIRLDPLSEVQMADFREFATTGTVPRREAEAEAEADVDGLAGPQLGPPPAQETTSDDISIDIVVDEESGTFGWSDVTEDDLIIDFDLSGFSEVKEGRTRDLDGEGDGDGSVTVDVPNRTVDWELPVREESFLSVRCSRCEADLGTARIGPAQGALGTLASHRPYWWPTEARIVSVLRLDPPRERKRSRLSLGETGLSRAVSLRLAFKVADLTGPPRCPDGSAARVNDLVRRLKDVESRLNGASTSALSGVQCPRCREEALEVERWS